jgi:predicted metal-dependent hydrolase
MYMKIKRATRLSIIGRQEVKLDGRRVEYTLKQSPRIRGIRLEVHNDSGLIVVVPRRYKSEQIDDILSQKSDWILRHLPSAKPAQIPLFRKEVDHGEKIKYMGKMIEVVVSPEKQRDSSASLKDNRLYISYGQGTASRAKLLEAWYRRQAANIFKEKADRFQAMMGLRYSRIVIRGQRKRWASASPLGNLSINWKLLLAPEDVIDYVIVHELAHFKHMDHSRNFWDYLAKYCPRWREYRRWLITHEDELKTAATFAR